MASQIPAVTLNQETFEVDSNGQAIYRIRLQLPPGIAGYAPELQLSYNHRSTNGLLGVGWSLSGLSVITRTKATYAVDGFNGAISYGPNDRLAIDGQRLINVEGEYGAGGTLYYTEMQTWQNVRAGKSPEDGFTVRTKDGQTVEYGRSASSRILATNSSLVRVWAMNVKTDRNGNRIEFDYTGKGGTCYIDTIRYTKRSDLDPQYLVQFTWEPRPDPGLDHVGGHAVEMAHRLKRITISLAGGEVIRTYALAYEQSTATGLSRITTITESGAQSEGSQELPPTTILWQDVATPGFVVGKESLLDWHPGIPDIRPMDLRGSGRTDCVQLWFGDGALHATSYMATGQGAEAKFERVRDTRLDTFQADHEILPLDVNGNGLTDLVVAYRSSPNNELCLQVFLSDGLGGFTNSGTFNTGDAWDANHIQFLAIDANGDGRTDLVEVYKHLDQGVPRLYFRSYLSKFGDDDPKEKMFTKGIVSRTPDSAGPDAIAMWAMDLNGDGMIDIVRVWRRWDSHIIATAYLSVSTSIYNTSFGAGVETDLGTFDLANLIGFQPVDVNGDGVQDLLRISQTSGYPLHLKAFLSNGAGGFVEGPDSEIEHETLTGGAFYPMDIDGHGLTAILGKWNSQNNKLKFTVFRASPSGKYRALPAFEAGGATNESFFPCDVNGDGKADLVRVGTKNQQTVLIPYISAGPLPDLALTITNQLGGAVDLQYAPLSDNSVYIAGEVTPPRFPGGQGRRFPNPMTPAQFPAQAVLGRATYVVSQYTQRNDAAKNRFAYSATTCMSYTGAQLNLLGRGWQGFRTVASLSKESGRRMLQTFNQKFPYTGTSASTRIEADGAFTSDPRVPSGKNALMSLTNSEYEEVVRAYGFGASKTKIVEVLKKSSRHEQYDYGTFDYAVAQTFGYDDYGNETLNVYLGYVDANGNPLYPSEVVYKYRRYQNDKDVWALGFLTASKVSAKAVDLDITRFAAGDYHLEIQTWAKGTYNLKTRAAWDSSNSVFLTTAYDYDQYGNQVSETTPGNFVTKYEYDPLYHSFRMRSTSPTDAQGMALVSTYGYDPRFGVQVANRDPNGLVTIAALDGFGRIVARQGPLPGSGIVSDTNLVTPFVTGSPELRQTFQQATIVTVEQTSFGNDKAGGLYSQTAALQSFPTDTKRDFVWNQRYVDGRARERETVRQTGQSAGNAVVLTDYNAADKVTMKSLPFFSATPVVTKAPHATTISYDVLGRPLVQNAPAGPDGNQKSVTTWTYAKGGMVTQVSAAGSSSPYTQRFEHHLYNLTDKIRRVTLDPGGANATSQFVYDGVARLLSATDPQTSANPHGVSNTVTYDSLDRWLTFDNPDQNTTSNGSIKAMTYIYDPVTGWLRETTDAAGAKTTYGYDHLDRMTSKTVADGRTFVYTYDTAVNGKDLLARVVAQHANASVESQYDFVYDPYTNVASTTVTIGGEASPFVTSAVFDPQNRVVRQTFPDATVLTRRYSFSQFVSQSLDGATTEYPLEQYSPWQKAGKFLYGDRVSDLRFNPTGQLIDETMAGPGGSILHYGYLYDLQGQLLAETDLAAPLQTQSFSYANRRLVGAVVPGFSAGSFGYDASGNLQSKDGVTFQYRAHYPMSGTAGGHAVYAGTPDACGRTKSRTIHGTTVTFDYDGLGFLRRVRNENGDTIREMVSNYLARLLRETDADGKVTLLINPEYVVTRDGDRSAATKYLFDDRGTVASIRKEGSAKTILYFRRDFKGSNTHAFSSGGTVVTRIAYDGYGRPSVLTGTTEVRPKYEQRSWDADLGLYYFGARFYDVFTGRFLTPDSRMGADDLFRLDVMNRFAFELNNPINNVDPTGNSVGDMWAGIAIGLALIGASVATVATFGAATPALAMGVGALVGAGLSGIVYSTTHADTSGGRFWGGYVASAAVGAAIGALTAGGASAFADLMEAKNIGTLGRIGWYALFGGATTSAGDTLSQFMSNVVDQAIVQRDVSLAYGLGTAAATGAIVGAFAGSIEGGYENYKLKRKPMPDEKSFKLSARKANQERPLASHFADTREAGQRQVKWFASSIAVEAGVEEVVGLIPNWAS